MKKLYDAPEMMVLSLWCDTICTSDVTGAWKWEDGELS